MTGKTGMMARQLIIEFMSIALYTYKRIVSGYDLEVFPWHARKLFY